VEQLTWSNLPGDLRNCLKLHLTIENLSHRLETHSLAAAFDAA
jgi:hypothetical protein